MHLSWECALGLWRFLGPMVLAPWGSRLSGKGKSSSLATLAKNPERQAVAADALKKNGRPGTGSGLTMERR